MTARIGGQAAAIALVLAAAAAADTIVTFPDPNLEAAVRQALGIPAPAPITSNDMLGMTELRAMDLGISDLGGLQYATNLEILRLDANNLRDLAPLAGLTRLWYLTIAHNSTLEDLSPLAGLVNLELLLARSSGIVNISGLAGLSRLNELELSGNRVRDISALGGLTRLVGAFLGANEIEVVPAFRGTVSLTHLYLGGNRISDISALADSDFQERATLVLTGNRLNQAAYDVLIPRLQEKYPNMHIYYDPIPEPGTLALVAAGVACVGRRLWRLGSRRPGPAKAVRAN